MNHIIEQVWKDFLKIIQEEVGIRVVETWIKAVHCSRYDAMHKKIYISAPNQFVKHWVETHYKHLFDTHLKRLLNVHELAIQFCIGSCETDLEIVPHASTEIQSVQKNNDIESADKKRPSKYGLVKKHGLDIRNSLHKLHPAHTFDTFVVGDNNSFAYASAQAVVNKLGKLYNPLLLYGSSGLGKTHLLHAVGNAVLVQNPEAVVLYQTADKFITEFVHAIRFDHIPKFQAKYKKIDVLLLDDIQFMINKEQTQEAFFHIFNSLYENNKQIVLSSDTLPRNLGGLADRLKSRLEWGLIADVQLPMLETKMAILKRKVALQQGFLSDEVALFIAHQPVKSVRELEGSLLRIMAYASLTNQEITIELARKVLGAYDEVEESKTHSLVIDFSTVALAVQKHFSCSLDILRSKDRSKGISHARHVAMYLMKKYTGKSLREVGEYLDRKDHTTITHAIHRIQELLVKDTQFVHQLKMIEQELLRHT